MNGEVLYREGQPKEAIAELQRAVTAEDALKYDEPPSWIQPVRHALGATLAQGKQYKEAEAVFRDDLARNPNNGWALLGLSRMLRLQGKNRDADAFERQFNVVWSKADVKIHSACLCQPGV
jgi:tetratricopeptide (TPR) repeat protein